MTTPHSRELLPCPFCGREAMMSHSRDGEVCNVRCAGWSVGNCLGAGPNCYTEADAVAGWNRRAPVEEAARALPADVKPAGRALTETLDKRETTTTARLWFSDPVNCMWTGLFTAAQVQAMGRVPPGRQAVPVEPTVEQINAAHAKGFFRQLAIPLYHAMLAAAPRPPAAPEVPSGVLEAIRAAGMQLLKGVDGFKLEKAATASASIAGSDGLDAGNSGNKLPAQPTSKQIVLMAGAILHQAHGTADTRHPAWAQAVEQAERAYRALVSA